MAETGYPGIPKMGVSAILPIKIGFPGMMVTPWTSTVTDFIDDVSRMVFGSGRGSAHHEDYVEAAVHGIQNRRF